MNDRPRRIACSLLQIACLCLWIPAITSYDSLFFSVEHPDSLKYVYEVSPSYSIGAIFPKKVHNVYLYYAEPENACTPLKNYDQVEGEAVLIERGDCSFVEKALNAYAAGAAFAIVTDSKNNSDSFINMIEDGTGRQARIPIAYLPGVSGRQFRQHFLYEDDYVVINIPLNLTMKSVREVLNKPPWELW
ncbi:PA domain-containing protein [Aphelenchoides fujianensis]|nr:PA domain-containing protein [Aphelenchoides fujianensis]